MIEQLSFPSGVSTTWFVLVGVALLALFLLGLYLGRRRRAPGLTELERALEGLAGGDLEVSARVARGDPARAAADRLEDALHRLRNRGARASGRAGAIGEALDVLDRRGIVVLDRDLAVSAISEGAARLAGERVIDVEGRPVQGLLDPDGFRELAALVAQHRREQTPFRTNLVLLRPGGERVPVVANGAWPDTAGEPLALFIEAEGPAGAEALGDTLRRYADVLAGLPDGVVVVSGGAVVEANPQARAWFGEGIVGAVLRDLVAVEDLLLVIDVVHRAEAGEPTEAVPCRLAATVPGLPARDVDLSAAPVRHGTGRAAALALHERPRDHRARGDEARLVSVLDTVEDGLLVLTVPSVEGSSWRVGLVNRRAGELFAIEAGALRGAPEEEFRGLVAHRFADPAGFAGLMESAAREPSAVHQGTFELAGQDGETLEVIVRPVLGAEGELLGRVLVARDITRHREVEKQLVADAAALGRSRESLQRAYEQLTTVNRDLERKTGELDRLNRELVELDRARAQLLGDVSHELQTPLVSIRGYCQMILEGRLGRINDEQRRGLEVALRNVDRMVEMINNLLALARSERNTPVQAEPVDPGEVIRDVLDRQQDAARRKGVRLEADNVEPGARLLAEREGLTQVLDNLVGNGIKFNRSGGRVFVKVQPGPAGFLKLEVADTGIGIAPEEHQRIFERFYRGRGSAGTAGSGIGLATVKNIVQRHGGAIELESSVGHGTLVRVIWPRADASSTDAAPPTAATR